MYKFLIIILMLFPVLLKSQEKLTYQNVDSLTNLYSKKGAWSEMINLALRAEHQGIEFNNLYQRAGYAYFMLSDFTTSQLQYEKAYGFDPSDPITIEYLYYCGLNLGNEEYSRYYALKLPAEAKKRLGITPGITPVGEVDAEYNYKITDGSNRSDPMYYRLGIKTLFGNRLSLYQAVSQYSQKIGSYNIRQPEYYARIKYAITPKILVQGAFHGINTKMNANSYPAYLGALALSSQLSRFNIEGNASVMSIDTTTVEQFGVQGNVMLPGKSSVYFTTGLSELREVNNSHTIFSQSVGLKCLKNLWAEGNITLGNLNNYNTLNALYVFNTYDPTKFRYGFSLFYFLNKHLSFNANFTYDQKEYTNNNSSNYLYYNQFSISGGLKWKL